MISRIDKRPPLDIRKLTLTRSYIPHAEGSCLVQLGETQVIVTASVEKGLPPWLAGKGAGWVTAEYGMLPRSTHNRIKRPSAGKPKGRSIEIQRLIGRSLRAVTRLDKLGEHTIYLDCDVITADGGTRTASIIGAAVALYDAGTLLLKKGAVPEHIMTGMVGAISVGLVKGNLLVDLNYEEDSSADVDMNIVMTESGEFVEVQGTAEGKTFTHTMLDSMLDAAESAIKTINSVQKAALGIS